MIENSISPGMVKWLFFGMLLFSGEAFAQVKDSITGSFQAPDSVTSRHHLIKPVAIGMGYAVSNYLCYRYLDTRIQRFSQRSKNKFETSIFSTVSNLGLGRTQFIELASTSVVALASRNKKLQRTVITWAGALVINSLVTDQVKQTFQRHRPNSGDAYNVFDWRGGTGFHRSFVSAHTSNVFTTATIFATLYHNHTWVPLVSYGIATLVGLSRIYENAHWASDVMAGAAVGFLSAKAMNGIYRKVSRKFVFLPQAGWHGGSVSLVYRF